MSDAKRCIGLMLAQARRGIGGYIKKDARVRGEGGSYPAVTHDAVTAHCRAALIDAGVIVAPEVVEHESELVELGAQKKPYLLSKLLVRVWFCNEDDIEDRIPVTTVGYGTDSFDKAPGKALSYAVKFALLKIFQIETGENEESRMSIGPHSKPQIANEPITSKQLNELERLLTERGGTMDRIYKDIHKRTNGARDVSSGNQLTHGDYYHYSGLLQKESSRGSTK